MKEICKIETRHLVAAYMATDPKASSRPMCQRVIMAPAPVGHGVNIYGTTGHYLYAGTDPDGRLDGGAIGLQLSGAPSAKLKKSKSCTVYQVDGHQALVMADSGETVSAELSEASDDADRIAPVVTSAIKYHTQEEPEPAHYDAAYLTQLHKIAKAYTGSTKTRPVIYQRGRNPALVDLSETREDLGAFALIMPIRCDQTRSASATAWVHSNTPQQSDQQAA